MTVVSLRVGGLAHDGAQVKAKLDGVTSARLAVDTDDQFGDPVFFEPVSSDSEGVRTFAPSGLEPGATYFYAVEQDDVLAPAGLLLDGTGDYASTPDDASLDITGDIDLRCEATLDDWASGSFQALLAKWLSPNRSYAIFVEPGGEVRLAWSTDGTSGNAATSTVAPDVEDGGRLALRTILDVDDGTGGWTARIYTAPTIDGPWTQLGDPVDNGGGGTTSIFSGTQELEAGSQSSGTANNITGIIHAVEARDGIDGTVVADPDFTAEPSGTASFDDDAGRTWTLNGEAEIGGTGRFVTAPGEPGEAVSYAVAVSGDAGQNPDFPDTTGQVLASDRISNHTVFDTIREHPSEPLFFIHPGDATYYDLGSDQHGIIGGGSLANYRRMFDDILRQPRQHELYRTIPTVYHQDDHGFGPNNSDGTLATKGNFSQAAREKVPSYPLPDPEALYQQWQIGRVQFIGLDTRYYRSPSPDPDGPAKTMLGSMQKQWLADVLNSSTADALVVVSSVPWIGGGGDAWPGYSTERQELADLFVSTGWADRMIMLCADAHKLGFDSGANNDWGGFPVYICASMDAIPNNNVVGYDIGEQGGRDQYAIVTVSDSGSDITLTTTGFSGSSAVMSHSLAIPTAVEPEPDPEPEPQPAVPQVAQAKLKAAMSWLACDLSTGKVLGSLPNLQVSQVSRVIGDYTSSSVQLPIPAVGGKSLTLSERAALAHTRTQPGRTMLVAVVNNIPLWAGIPLSDSWGTPATTPLGYASVDAYLRHRYVRDHDWELQDTGSVIAAQLLTDANAPIDGHGGGIGLVIDAQSTGRLESRKYRFFEHRSVYDALTKLMAAGGLEWTIDVDWKPGQVGQFISLIARVRPHLGIAATSGPHAVFTANVFSSTGAASASYALDGDYSDGSFANVVYAYSSGQGEKQPVSDPAIDNSGLDAGAPIWEKHFQPEQSISSIALLDAHADAELARVRRGRSALNVEAVWNAYPRYGIDWQLGDDVGVKLFGHGHPEGLTGVRRAVGFRLNPSAGTIVPILQEDI